MSGAGRVAEGAGCGGGGCRGERGAGAWPWRGPGLGATGPSAGAEPVAHSCAATPPILYNAAKPTYADMRRWQWPPTQGDRDPVQARGPVRAELVRLPWTVCLVWSMWSMWSGTGRGTRIWTGAP